jgi:hypothetical protein
LQALELLAAVEPQAADLHVAQFDGHRQFQIRQLDRPAALFPAGGNCRLT